jgi:hypothetical protein
MRSGDSTISGAHATSIKDRVGLFEAADPQHSPTTNASAAAFFETLLGSPRRGGAGLKEYAEAGSAFVQDAGHGTPGPFTLGMFGRGCRASRPLIRRITTIDSERSRPRLTPAVSLPDGVHRPFALASPPWSRSTPMPSAPVEWLYQILADQKSDIAPAKQGSSSV